MGVEKAVMCGLLPIHWAARSGKRHCSASLSGGVQRRISVGAAQFGSPNACKGCPVLTDAESGRLSRRLHSKGAI
jgi:hypothetical protein